MVGTFLITTGELAQTVLLSTVRYFSDLRDLNQMCMSVGGRSTTVLGR